MLKNLIPFEQLEWESPVTGVQQKVYSDGNQRLRLLRFDDQFKEEDWCTRGHIGLVLEGSMTIDFNGVIKQYQKGDGLWIEAGEASKHKAAIEKGQYVELILFEQEG